MGFFEKLGLVEREEVVIPTTVKSVEEPVVEANAEINSTENVINEIYAQNGLADKDNSIYAVQSFIDTLPSEMTTAKKQSSVYGILKVTGKSVDGLMGDANDRINLLCSARDKVVAEKNAEIEAAKSDIEDLKRAIEAANIIINKAEEVKDTVNKSVNDEIGVIEELVKFCEGMGDK